MGLNLERVCFHKYLYLNVGAHTLETVIGQCPYSHCDRASPENLGSTTEAIEQLAMPSGLHQLVILCMHVVCAAVFMCLCIVFVANTDGRLAPDLCFTEVNRAGDMYGNCGKDLLGKYRSCKER